MKKSYLVPLILIAGNAYAQSDSSGLQGTQLFLIILVIAVLALLLIDLIGRRKRPEDTAVYRELNKSLESRVTELDQLKGRDEHLQQVNSKLESSLESRSTMISNMEKQLASYKANENRLSADTERKIRELDSARKALEQERARVVRQEEEEKAKAKRNRNRIWAVHEDNAQMVMKTVCQKNDIALGTFDNTHLPDGFDPKLKPDFLLRLLDQYIIFDAKSSQSQSLETYIKNQVKSTAQKIRQSDSFSEIYKAVFFVIPNIGLTEISETYYVEQGISFFVISLEAFEPIVRTLKRLEDYDLADKYDPQERENIVNVLAAYDNQIRQQNSINIMTAIRGLQVMEEKKTIPEEVVEAVDARRAKMRLEQLSSAELKKLMEDPQKQIKEIQALIEPNKPEIDTNDLKDSAKIIS